MTANLGTFDRIFRVVLGMALLIAPFAGGFGQFDGSVATILSVIAGLVMIGTSSIGFCPLYRIFGIRTCKL